jgi:SOS-response transcriptional repressor LexA
MAKQKANPADLLTISQMDVLIAIREHVRKHRVSPSRYELADGLGVTRPNIDQSIAILRRKGVLHCTPGRARTLVVTRKGHIEANKPRVAVLGK